MNDVATGRDERIAALGYDYAAQPHERLDRCNLCGHDRLTVVTHRDRYGYPARASGCRRCGLVFLNPRMTGEAYGRFYDGVYRPLVSAYHGRLIDAGSIQQEQAEYAEQRAEFLADFLPPSDRQRTLLDIGGSTGVVAAHLAQRFDLAATILDPAPAEIEAARALGLETVTGLVETWDAGDRRFDLVALFQTVDHLLDVAGTLARSREILADDGRLFVDIVDFRAGYLRNNSVEEAVKIDHPYYLTEATIEAYLARAGFEVLGVDYAADHLHVGYVCRAAESRPEALPAPDDVAGQWREIRAIQNSPRS